MYLLKMRCDEFCRVRPSITSELKESLLSRLLRKMKKSRLRSGGGYGIKRMNFCRGVTVRLLGTSLGTSTDTKGWFAITLPVLKGTLEFSFIGYKKQKIDFTEKNDTLRVVMEEDVAALEEVVVRAYGTQNKREVIGAISSVKAEEMKELPTASIVNMLQGSFGGSQYH